MPVRLARGWHLLTAVVSGGSLLLQLVLVLASDNDTVLIRLIRLVSYFTIQSNLIVTAVAIMLVRDPRRDGAFWRVARLASVVCIGVTGLVYVAVLRDLFVLGPLDRIANAGLHYATPVLAVLGWALFGPRPRVDLRVVRLTLAYPVLWLAYILARGAIVHEYPYPFVDVDEQGYAAVFINCLVVTVVFLALSGLVWLLDRSAPPAPSQRRATVSGQSAGREAP